MQSTISLLKVIVAAASSYTRLVLSDILNEHPDIEVADTAESSQALLTKVKTIRPDLLVMDLDISEGNELLRQVAQECPVPVLLLAEGERLLPELLEAGMQWGVYDFIRKPSNILYPQLRSIREELLNKALAVKLPQKKVKIPETDTVIPAQKNKLPEMPAKNAKARVVVVIGASTGGTAAIETIIQGLKPDLQATVLIAVHMPENFTGSFARRLREQTTLKVMEGKRGLRLLVGKVIISPGGRNMIIGPYMGNKDNLKIFFSEAGANAYDKPSVDILMKSVAEYLGENTLGVILTGMGRDGTKGAREILSRGGEVIAQDKETSVIFGMAKSVIEKGLVTQVLPLSEMAQYINRFVERHKMPVR